MPDGSRMNPVSTPSVVVEARPSAVWWNHDIVRKLTDAGITCWTDKGYRGAGGTVRVPLGPSGDTSRGQKDVNRSHVKKWVLVEQAAATLKAWRLLRNLRCSTSGVTSLVRSVVTVHLASTDGKGSMTTF